MRAARARGGVTRIAVEGQVEASSRFASSRFPPQAIAPAVARAGARFVTPWALILGPACVLPTNPVTGIEVVWSLEEQEASDGDEARRPRTCRGALLDRVLLTLTDEVDPERTRTTRFDCEVGYQTADEIATLASPVFFDLRPGSYTLTATADGPGGEVSVDATIVVDEARVARGALDLSPRLVPWTLEIIDPEACVSAFEVGLRYADPAEDLADAADAGPAEAADLGDSGSEPADPADPMLYRAGLVSAGGLGLGGQVRPCAEAYPGVHAYLLDPGRYVLRVAVDDRTCEVPVEIAAASPGDLVLDLAKLPCDG